MKKTLVLSTLIVGAALLLGACSSSQKESGKKMNHGDRSMESSQQENSSAKMEMNHEGVIPKLMNNADNPKYPVGSKVKLLGDHMEGMKGAQGEVVEAFDTTVYSISYRPVSGDNAMVGNHQWVVDEEVTPREAKVGDRVRIEADHMPGMRGADAAVESAEKAVVYVVDYQPTTSGEIVKNHLWVTEDELEKE